MEPTQARENSNFEGEKKRTEKKVSLSDQKERDCIPSTKQKQDIIKGKYPENVEKNSRPLKIK
jgi:hypothetical protein